MVNVACAKVILINWKNYRDCTITNLYRAKNTMKSNHDFYHGNKNKNAKLAFFNKLDNRVDSLDLGVPVRI